ncbi:MAG: septum formation inhibitor Maf [Clostridia bacterium]|nr:septum formation inhibitor Maf [Clostridia bacterium]
MTNETNLILASASPRRHELLTAAGIPHTVLTADTDESLPDGILPHEAVEMLSLKKAQAVLPIAPDDAIILAADTVVALDGGILGKPQDEADAKHMLESLSGREHHVYTGVTVTDGKTTVTTHARTTVRMRTLTDAEIDAYIATGEPMDKAGAYGIQGRASLFVTGIEGDYANVVGLPVSLVGEILKEQFQLPLF